MFDPYIESICNFKILKIDIRLYPPLLCFIHLVLFIHLILCDNLFCFLIKFFPNCLIFRHTHIYRVILQFVIYILFLCHITLYLHIYGIAMNELTGILHEDLVH